ncbi:hypothetical protein [Leptodesmis sp.]|uniref:hypothetical protein n=1 Tax=Leptodesmis sp. TaxID=3100501 RepID=UPI0040534D77
MYRTLRYWVLLLSQASTRLLVGTGEALEEIADQTFAMQMTGPGATTALPYNSIPATWTIAIAAFSSR